MGRFYLNPRVRLWSSAEGSHRNEVRRPRVSKLRNSRPTVQTGGNALSFNLNQNAAKHTPKHKCTTNNNFEHKRVLHNLRFMGFIIKGQSANKRHCKKNIWCYNIIMSEPKKQRESHVKSLRLLQLEKAIQSIAYPSVERLMKELEVSRRTILRDLDELKLYYNAPIEYDRLHKGYYYTDETFFVKNVLISEGELVAMAGILPLLERYDNTPLKDTITKVYQTISQMLPNQV